MKLSLTSALLSLAVLLAPLGSAPVQAAGGCSGSSCLFLPSLMTVKVNTPPTTGATYHQGIAVQFDLDNPVRPASQHADKNLSLRGLIDVTNNDQGTYYYKGLLGYGLDDTQAGPPQLAYLFSPARGPAGIRYYRTRDWNWASSPSAGSAGAPITRTLYPITGLGVATTAGEKIYAPRTLHDNPIAPGYHMMVMYADENNIALKYTVEDTGATGYTVHIRGIQVDANLLSLYRSLDGGNRYIFSGRGSRTYNLPYITAGQPIGFAIGTSIQLAVVDTGTFLDPRSCQEFWIGFYSNCPARNGNEIR